MINFSLNLCFQCFSVYFCFTHICIGILNNAYISKFIGYFANVLLWTRQQHSHSEPMASLVMFQVVLALLAAVATAAPQYEYAAPQPHYSSEEVVAILRDDRVMEDDGRYNFEVETANGITVSEAGSHGVEGAINSAGYFA